MILILDGYNILKYILKKDFATQKERQWFLSMLTNYAKSKHHTIILVFDGGPYYRPTITKKGKVTVLFSGERENADRTIKDYIDEHRSLSLALVSSDRELCKHASKSNVLCIPAHEFATYIQGSSTPSVSFEKSKGLAHKLHEDESNPELDALMQEGSAMIMHKNEEPDDGHHKKASMNKLSKSERKMLKITRKL